MIKFHKECQLIVKHRPLYQRKTQKISQNGNPMNLSRHSFLSYQHVTVRVLDAHTAHQHQELASGGGGNGGGGRWRGAMPRPAVSSVYEVCHQGWQPSPFSDLYTSDSNRHTLGETVRPWSRSAGVERGAAKGVLHHTLIFTRILYVGFLPPPTAASVPCYCTELCK